MGVAEIIRSFGGTSALAAALGVPISTVHAWKTNSHIPAWRQPAILRLAVEQRVSLSSNDFPEKPQREAA